MGREAKGQKDPLGSVAMLPPIEVRAHEPPLRQAGRRRSARASR